MKRYKSVEVDYGENTEYMASFKKKPKNTENVRFDSSKPESRHDYSVDEPEELDLTPNFVPVTDEVIEETPDLVEVDDMKPEEVFDESAEVVETEEETE